MKNRKDQNGFSFVEVLSSLFIGLLLLSAIYFSVATGQKSSAALERKVAAQQDVRAALQIMNLEISMASYNPNYSPGPWRNAVDCTLAAATGQTNKGIQEATNNALTLQMDLGGNGVVGDEENEIIRFRYDPTTERITRERILCNSIPPTTGEVDFLGADPSSGFPRTVRVINQPLGLPVFSYFDGRGVATSNIPDIRRIDVTLAVETDEIDASTGERRRMIYPTSIIPRNHAISQ
jgi:type II secretory pathway component PulJ